MTESPLPEGRPAPAHPFPVTAVESTDEIRAVDLLVILVRSRWLFFGVLAGTVVLTLAAWYFLPTLYHYRTTLELGGIVAEQKIEPIESPQSVRAKLENTWIPTYPERLPDPETAALEVEVSIPRGTNLLILTSQGTEAEANAHLDVHEAVLRPLIDETRKLEELQRQKLANDLQAQQLELAAIRDDSTVLETRKELLQEERKVLEEESRELSANIEMSRRQWLDSVGKVEEETQAVILLMLETEIRKNQGRLEEINRRLRIGLAQDLADLGVEQQDIKRSEEQQAAVIAALEARLSSFRGLRTVGSAVRSEEPTGFGGLDWPVAVLFAVLAGLGAALAAVFVARLRTELRMRSEE